MNNRRTAFVKTFQSVEEQVSSLLSAQLLEFCESDDHVFQETIQNPEVSSSSNGCYEEQSRYVVIKPSVSPHITKCPTRVDNTVASASITTTTSATTNNDSPLMFEDKVTPLDLSNTSQFANNQYPLGNYHDQFDTSSFRNEDQSNDPVFSYLCAPSNDHVVPLIRPKALLKLCEEDIISPISPSKFMLSNNMLSSNYHFADPSINSNLPMSTEFRNLCLRNEIQIHGNNNNGTCYTDHLPQSLINSNDINLQAFSNVEDRHLVNGCGSSTIPLTSDISSLESESLRGTNKLTSEERKEKISKYMKKRNERNFNKKIKYACRKTLADSRPRVRGRFAKHDEFGEYNITNNNHEELDTDEDEVMKDEDENFESSDILAHISGVNSFNCNYSIQSWI